MARCDGHDTRAAGLAERPRRSPRAGLRPNPHPGQIHDRIGLLQQLFTDAPADQSRIIDDLIAGNLATPDLHAALAEARSAQTERDRWILANWPHIVEHHELHRLAEQHDPLAHWPTPIRPTVEAVLDKLAARLDPTAPVEARTLAELETAIASLDPGARLRDLTEQLVAVNDRLHRLEAERRAEGVRSRASLLTAELETLRANQRDVRNLIDSQRQTLSRRTLAPTDHDALRAAVTHRTETIYQQAIRERPDWLVELLTELDDRGTLQQVRLSQVQKLTVGAATSRDLDLQGTTVAAERPIPARSMSPTL